MDTIIVTSQVGVKIVPVQKWLFAKYAPDIELWWIDLEGRHLEKWCENVAKGIDALNPSKYILFMLDDHLLLDTAKLPKTMPPKLDRLELGERTRHHKVSIDRGDHLELREEALYRVSTQPSIWRTDALLRVLREVNSSPWKFETKGRCKAGIVKNPAIKVIPESAISGRKPGKVNINGMKPEDVDELVELGLLERSELVNSWR